MNAAWHAKHPMPRPATISQRVAWHRAHKKHCNCRPIPGPLVALVNAAERRVREKQEAADIRELLTGGDRRSIAQGTRAQELVERDPALVDRLVELTSDTDWLVRQRALDILEKLAHDHPAWVEPYKRVFLGPLADSEQWEILLQIVRALPLFRWTSAQRKRVEEILMRNVSHPQTFVRAWALDSLARLAESNPSLEPLVARSLDEFEESSSKALQARARKIRERREARAAPASVTRSSRRRSSKQP
jgi:HEAT repeat protein